MATSRGRVSILIDAKDRASREIRQADGALGKLRASGRAAAIALTAVAAAVTTVAVGFDKMAKRGGDVVNVQRAFNTVFPEGEAALRSMRKATLGLIGDYDLMVSANRAMALGAVTTKEQFNELAEAALTLGRAQGVDAKMALESLSLGIGRQSRLLLDNLGIIVSVEKANEAYAASVGKSVKELTDAERAEAFRTAALDAAREKIEQLGGVSENNADNIQRIKVAFGNSLDAANEWVATSPAIADALDNVGARAKWAADKLGEMGQGFRALRFDAQNAISAIEQAIFNNPLTVWLNNTLAPFLPDLPQTPQGPTPHGDTDAGIAAATRRALAGSGGGDPPPGAGGRGPVNTTGLELGRVMDRVDSLTETLAELKHDAAFATTAEDAEKFREKIEAVTAELNRAKEAARRLTTEGMAAIGAPGGGPVDSGATAAGAQSRKWGDDLRWFLATGGADAAAVAGPQKAAERSTDALMASVGAFQAVSMAAIRGAEDIESILIPSIANIAAASIGGPWGAAVGALGAVVGTLFGGNDRPRVVVDEYGPRAERQMQESREPVRSVFLNGQLASEEQLRQLGYRQGRIARLRGESPTGV